MDPRRSPYAVPLETLDAARVGVSEQVECQGAVPPPPWEGSGVLPHGGGGATDVEGDGD